MYPLETLEQTEIRNTVRRLAQSEIPKYQRAEFYGTVPRELFASMGELGLTGITISESHGGMNACPVTCAIIMEELAKVDLGVAIFYSVHCMVSGLIQKFASDDQQKRFLPKLASGESLAAFCLTESVAGSDAAGLRTQAKQSGNGFTLQGEKCWITSAGFADLYLIFAKTDPERGKQGISAFIVEAGAEGLSAGPPEKKMGAELSPIATLQLEQVQVPVNQMLGELNAGYQVALGGLSGGRINIAACGIGLAQAALSKAFEHVQEREQFGRKLVEFQGLQFMLADMKMKLESARLMTWHAAYSLREDPNARANRILSSMAKCTATDAAMEIATDAVQLLGGAGYVQEYQVERFMRDAKMLQIVEGTNQIQRTVIVREMMQ